MKKFIVALLASISIGLMAMGAAACSFEFDKTQLAFNEEYLQEIVLGEPIMLDEYIDPSLTDDYTAILTCDETGEQRDLKNLIQWTTDKPGTYTLTYTVNSGEYKGTISTKINVVVADAEWSYSNPTLAYRAGETMSFNYLKRMLNIAVDSYYKWDFYVKEVTHNGQVEDVTEQTSYTFPEHGKYDFLFGVKTLDGQVLEATHTVSVRKQQVLANGAEEWMEENNITAYDYTYISAEGKVELDQGYCNGSYVKDNVPYLAFNGPRGGYGANTYVMTDFTGKNLPQIAFFCNDVKPSFTDGSNGVLLYNAMFSNGGSLLREPHPSRMTIFGPYKASYGEFDNKGRLFTWNQDAQGTCPASWNGLDENCQYRYIAGIEKASSTSMTLRILLINLTTNERVMDFEQKLERWTGNNGGETLNVSDSYYSGSIVLYGNYGSDLSLDKVYLPITGIGSIYELDEAAEFKDDFKKSYALGEKANVSDYIERIPGEFSEFIVTDPDGQQVAIAADGSFSYTKGGTYRLSYIRYVEGVRPSSVTVRVMYDLNNKFAPDYFEGEGVIQSFQANVLGVTQTNPQYVKEGSTSIRYYTINAISADKTLDVFVAKAFTDFVFLSNRVAGVSFEIYSDKALTFTLRPTTTDPTNAAYLREDYTGTIPAETWTTITLSRELMDKNYNTYKSASYIIALSLTSATGFAATDQVYIDNIQLLADPEPTADVDALMFMTTNNMTAYGYKEINADMSATLYRGLYHGNATEGGGGMTYNDVPYIAYNGNYGAGNYVVVDFTGKNIPQLCFFVKEITNSLIDGKAGLYVHTGMTLPNGDHAAGVHDAGRVTFLGPNKIEYGYVNSSGRVGPQYGYMTNNPVNSPMSVNGLVDGVHYRYVVGIKSAKAGEIVLQQLLINLDTNTEEVRYETKFTGSWITADYISGNIVMYSRYNVNTTLDKIYPVYSNVTDINNIDKVNEGLNK